MFALALLLDAAATTSSSLDPYAQIASHGVLGALVVVMLIWNYRLTTQLQAAQQARVDDAKAVAERLVQVSDKVNQAVNQTAQTVDRLTELQRGSRPS